MDLVLGGQLGHRFLFLQNFKDQLDLQFDGIALSKRAHNVLKTPLIFCLNFPIHYNLSGSKKLNKYFNLEVLRKKHFLQQKSY